MEIEFLKKQAHHVEFKLIGETHTFANLLKAHLVDDPNVEFVAYKLEHPLGQDSHFILRTKEKESKKVLLDAVKRLQEDLKELKESFTKALK
ncbi:MAG: DNA-directed RNA polymerase subunit L [Candidatus Diapherotrites archaeon]|nr:DNA-directed RNA polymerase subunit L [Candidatus Diapherotrites archaeon]